MLIAGVRCVGHAPQGARVEGTRTVKVCHVTGKCVSHAVAPGGKITPSLPQSERILTRQQTVPVRSVPRVATVSLAILAMTVRVGSVEIIWNARRRPAMTAQEIMPKPTSTVVVRCVPLARWARPALITQIAQQATVTS